MKKIAGPIKIRVKLFKFTNNYELIDELSNILFRLFIKDLSHQWIGDQPYIKFWVIPSLSPVSSMILPMFTGPETTSFPYLLLYYLISFHGASVAIFILFWNYSGVYTAGLYIHFLFFTSWWFVLTRFFL